MKKIALWIFASVLVLIGAFVSFKYWKLSRKWISVVYLESNVFSHKEIGEFKSLEQCKSETAANLKTYLITEKGLQADRYFCGRGCLIDAFVGNISIDEYQCAEKHFNDGSIK